MAGFSLVLFGGILSFLCMVFVGAFLVFSLYTIIGYILESITIQRMSSGLGYPNRYAAWIPFYNKLLLGRIANSTAVGAVSGVFTLAAVCLAILVYRCQASRLVLFLLLLVCLLTIFVLDTITAHRIFRRAGEANAGLLTALSILTLGLPRPVLLFALRNNLDPSTHK